MSDRTNRFEKIEGSHFQRMRVAFLELVKLAREGGALTEGETRTLEQIAIAFVTREIDMRTEAARYALETLELANEQLLELKPEEVQHLIDGLSNIEPVDDPLHDDLCREPRPRVFLKFETPEMRAKRQAVAVRRALLADQMRPGPWISVPSIPPAALKSAEQLVEQARMELASALGRLRGPEPCSVAEEQAQLVDVITRASYLWSALRFTQ